MNKSLFLSSTEIGLFQVTREIYFSIPLFDSRKGLVSIYIGFRYQIMASCTKDFQITQIKDKRTVPLEPPTGGEHLLKLKLMLLTLCAGEYSPSR